MPAGKKPINKKWAFKTKAKLLERSKKLKLD